MADLDELTPVSSGMKLRDVLTSKRITAIQNLIIRMLRGEHVSSGNNIRLKKHPNGYIIASDARAGEEGGDPVAFEVLNASTASQHKIRVRFGTVTTSTGPWMPTGMSPGDSPEFIFNVGNNGYVALIVTVNSDDSEVNSVTIGELPIDEGGEGIVENTETKGHLILGSFSTTGGNFSVASENVGSQSYMCCGGLHYFFKA